MVKKIKKYNNFIKFFFCPASDYLNQHNETGSHGILAYFFLRHLAMKSIVENICAVVMMSMPVENIKKTEFIALFHKGSKKRTLNDFHSLFFYIISYFRFFRSSEYLNASIVHHIIPFKIGRTFNIFFLFKNRKKKYIIGPIVSHHVNDQISSDEEYFFIKRRSISQKLLKIVFEAAKTISLSLFSSLLKKFSIKTLQNADIVFFSDNYSLNQHQRYIKKNQKIVVLDTGVDISIFKPSNKIVQKKKKDIIKILFVGRLTKRKGCQYLIGAIAEARDKKKDINIHCDILGYGPLKDELINLVTKLNLTNYITFLEGVKNEELVSYYHSTDIICIPALSDTFTVIKEGMASGKPIIVTDVSSHGERVKTGENGFVVPIEDSKAIADILLKLANNPSILNKLSKNTLKTRSRYDWNKITDRYIEAINEKN